MLRKRHHHFVDSSVAAFVVPLIAILTLMSFPPNASAAPLLFACSPDNDLFRVATENGIDLKRFDTPQAAVDAASDGDGVLVLADGYPEKTTELDAAFFDAAAQKKLRIYVEFPSYVPSLEFGPPAYQKTGYYNAVVERTVVTSDAFAPDLPKDRILMIHDCHYLPVNAANPHLVLAAVEGYDSLACGLPEVMHPLLFEHPDGGILVATTKLSQFVTARYSPTEAWAPIWRMILGWLQPGRDIPTLRWTPTVRPTYGPADTLAPSAQHDALRRATQWYVKSRLFMHPDWPAEIHPGIDPLPADAPLGDGSNGFAEGYIGKRIYYDGNQALNRNVRADCNLESAMGLACGAKVFQDADVGQRAQRLGDLIFFNSSISQGPRNQPDSPSYGLLGWAEAANDNYWGDDNARTVLSAITASALLETDRWDESIAKTILANFRTTGIYGFRPSSLQEQSLQQLGWRSFFERVDVSYCPHMQSWLWVTYLWLYDKTHFEPLLQRARQGLRMTMAAYPNWVAEANRVEAERCRMLLPLAWLVRVDDTPEHRQWLDTIARYVIELQDASGAIPQIPATVLTSNGAYGTGECAIVHQAGDPATDALYTINFAFIGMHEAAAATGDERYAQAADKMADFFIRTQTRSETHPELDGTWYRGFDFKKWDYWASDGDWGWGVWTAESGWTHSWITATLALREMNTSLWTLTQNTQVQKPFETLRPQVLPGDVLSDRAQIDLSGEWRFQVDRQNEGETAGWFAEDRDMTSWVNVPVPVGFDDCGPGLERYAGTAWFRKNVYVPESFRGRRVALRFDGISYNAKVWVNGKCVGENHDAFLPFELPIDEAVRVGAENEIAVRIDNVRQRAQFPLFEGWYGQGGFLRKAYLVATDKTYIDHMFIDAEPSSGGGLLRVRASVTNGAEQTLPIQIHVCVTDGQGQELAVFSSSSISTEPGKTGELSIDSPVPGVQLWSPDTPALYTVRVALLQEGRLLDTQTRRVGFRRIEVRDAKLLLNGQPLFLMGFNRHEDSPRTGMAVDLQQAREDFTAMKELGCNFVRLCHYPHDSGELDLCDELGLLVQAENAMNEWGHVDHPDPNGGIELKPEDAPLVIENAKRTLRKMVSRDNHHPSILFWSISNENAEERPEVAAGNQELIQFGRTLDPTRPWAHDSNSFNKDGWQSFYQADDLIVVNVYPTHHLTITPADLDAGLPQATKYMEDTLAKLHQQFPNKPIVIGEFGYFGGESGEEGARLQSIATEAEFKGLSAPYVAGCALWVYARHAWGTKACYAGDNLISPYGYVSRDRKTRFPALAVVERLYKERAQAEKTSRRTESGASGPVDKDGRPLIKKLGAIDTNILESSPFEWKGRLYRMEWRHPDYYGVKAADCASDAEYFSHARTCIVDHESGEVIDGPDTRGFVVPSLYVDGDTAYVIAAEVTSGNRADIWRSHDLREWRQSKLLEIPGWRILNTSLCRTENTYALAIEVLGPESETGVSVTARFARSPDLQTWEILPKQYNYDWNRYTSPHLLRYLEGYFYLFVLESLPTGYPMTVARSKDLMTWEPSPMNPVMQASDEDKTIANPALPADKQRYIQEGGRANEANISNSELDFVEHNGSLIINYGCGAQSYDYKFLAEAVYEGTTVQFLKGWFPEKAPEGCVR